MILFPVLGKTLRYILVTDIILKLKIAQGTLELVNCGSTVIFYDWTRIATEKSFSGQIPNVNDFDCTICYIIIYY